MKQEVDHWKTAAERLQKENTQLQKESLKLTHELMERVKMIKSKDDTISKLKSFAPVEEAIC
jgi:ubiquinone biosynthesis protein COQ9